MEIEKLLDPIDIPEHAQVRVKVSGNIIEVMYMLRRSSGGYISKVDKDTYIDCRTGEIKEFNHTEKRKDDIRAVRDTLRQGRDIINANVTDVDKCRWITLTYHKNMTDSKKLYKDFENFNVRMRKKFGHYEYITAVEPQGRGAWHLHAILIFERKAPYMSNDDVFSCWKNGFVRINSLKNNGHDIDNVGAYLTAYLGDVELKEQDDDEHYGCIKTCEFEDENGVKIEKRYIKGERIKMYPRGFHIFRWSRGIKKPDVSMMDYSEARKKVRCGKQTFSKTLVLNDMERNFKNVLKYEYYNIKKIDKSQV